MKVLRRIKTTSKGEEYSLSFGIPDTDEELKEMFRLRYKVYVSETGYGQKEFFPEEKEYDEYDLKKKCQYFLATLGKKVVGTSRLVITTPLPVKKDYLEFQEPQAMKKIPCNQVVEVSRLISRPHKFVFPRFLIMLGLFDSMLQFSRNNNFRAGYAVIDQPLMNKLKKIKFPFYSIEDFRIKKSSLTQKFPGYFSSRNKLYLIYFFGDEAERYIQRILDNKHFFEKIDEKTLIFKNKFYYKLINWVSEIFSS